MGAFVDPGPLYASPEPLSTRVDAFARYLHLADGSADAMASAVAGLASEAVLDLGCGVGVPLLPVGPTVFSQGGVVGVDLSQAQLGFVAREQVSRGLPRRLVAAGAEGLPFPGATFDLVLARHMLYHVAEPSTAVAEVVRVLRPGGALVATTNSSSSRAELQEAHRQAVTELGGRLVERVSARFAAENGTRVLAPFFDEVTTVPWQGALVFPDVDAVLAYYRSAAYFQGAFDDEAGRERLAAAVGDRLARLRTDDGIAVSVAGAVFVARSPRWARR